MKSKQERQLIKPLIKLEQSSQVGVPEGNMGQERQLIKPLIKPLIKLEQSSQVGVPEGNMRQERQLIKPLIKLEQSSQVGVPEGNIGQERQLIKPLMLEEPQLSIVQETKAEMVLVNPQIPNMTDNQCQIYIPQENGINKYLKQAEIKKTPLDIAEYIKSRVTIKTLDGDFYVFIPRESVFKRYNNYEMSILIDTLARAEITKMSSSGAYKEVINYLRCDHTIKIDTEEKPLPGNIWVFADFFIDVNSGSQYSNNGSYFITSSLLCNYNRSAICTNFDRFLFSVTGGDVILAELIWEIIGYVLSTDISAKNFFTFIGPKDTGKTLLAKIIAAFFPKSSISGLDITDFGQRFAISELLGKRINLCLDLTDEGIPSRAVGKIKSITGGDWVRGEQKFKSGVLFENYAKLIFASNHPLRTEKQDDAFFKRQIIVPFSYPVPQDKQDKQLFSKLTAELPGIAIKAIEAYKRLARNNYVFPEIYKNLPQNLTYDDEKIVSDFIIERCDFTDRCNKLFTQDIYNAYEAFCIKLKVQAIPDIGGFSTMFNQISGKYVERKKINIGGKTLQGYIGVKIR